MIRIGHRYVSKEIWYHRVDDYFRVFSGVEKGREEIATSTPLYRLGFRIQPYLFIEIV
jgi:hypothetical protein